jgi:hypothetical protein
LYRGQAVRGAVPMSMENEEAKKRQIKDLRRIETFITGVSESPIPFANILYPSLLLLLLLLLFLTPHHPLLLLPYDRPLACSSDCFHILVGESTPDPFTH